MRLQEDEYQFDDWQSYFSLELLKSIKEQLDAAGLPAQQVQELTTSIGFNVSCLIDASAEFSIDGKTITPYLTFSVEDDVLVHQGSPSDLHEYVTVMQMNFSGTDTPPNNSFKPNPLRGSA